MKLLAPLGKVYGFAMDARNALYDRGILKTHDLGARTISVGNITTGGTGKTPLVGLIAEMLLNAGDTVCILTRGYGRRDANRRVLVSDGKVVHVDAAIGGDEPVELAHRLNGRAVIIADSDRVSAARWAKENFGITVFVLDDGFQHRRARRDLDIVCIDATNPCGGGRVLPAGRLREPFRNLARAAAIVLTRSNFVDDPEPIIQRLRRRNATAPIFKAETRLNGLVPIEEFNAKTQSPRDPDVELRGEPVGVFCALGNPDAFFRTMDGFVTAHWGSGIVLEKAFPDHHLYTQQDIYEIERQAEEAPAELLVTTAKDAVKLKGLKFTIPCCVAIGDTAIDDVDAFRRMVVNESN